MAGHLELIGGFLPKNLPPPLILPDGWITRSVLQKAIRRGEIDLAGRAARTLWHTAPDAAWKRMLGISYEDVGVGNLDAVLATTAAASSKWRKSLGTDEVVAVAVARMLAAAVKDRGAEGLACAAANHPSLGSYRHLLTTLAIPHVLGMVLDTTLPLVERATAAWHASGVDLWPNRRVGPGDLPALLQTYRKLGAPEETLGAVAMALRRVREPMFVIFPLLVLAMDDGCVIDSPLPPSPMVGDVPLCALDKFTRTGKAAIARLASSTPAICAALNDLLPARLWAKATGYGTFYAEGGRVRPKRVWRDSGAIERLGIEADFLSIGFPADCISGFLALVETELPNLNAIRAELLATAYPLYNLNTAPDWSLS
jgi:hypothetical protein